MTEQTTTIMQFKQLAVSAEGDGVHIITLQRLPENRLDKNLCQALITAYNDIVRWLSSSRRVLIHLL
jgi:hypothetical protein